MNQQSGDARTASGAGIRASASALARARLAHEAPLFIVQGCGGVFGIWGQFFLMKENEE
jgi:hypothetical protein